MAHIGKGSALVGKNELNLFGVPPTQVAAERSKRLTIFPKNTVPESDVSTPITFEISGVLDFLDLHKNLLKTRFQIKKADGDNIEAAAVVAPINFIANSFIKQFKIFLNNRLVYDSQDSYMHRSYIEVLINASNEVKTTQLQLAGWYKDEYSADTDTTTDTATNPGFFKRKGLAATSKIFEVLAPLHSDLFNQNQYMLPNVKLRIELYRNSPSQTLMKFTTGVADNVEYSLNIKNIEFMVRTVEIAKSLAITIEKQLSRQMANYPIKRTVIRAIQFASGTSDVQNLEVYNGQLPTTMLVTFISSDAYNGNIGNSPFQYKHFNLQHIQASVGGRRWPTERPLELNIANDEIADAYFHFVNNCGFGDSLRESNGVTLQDYKRHSFFIAFDFRSDEQDDNVVDLIKHGETRIFLKFRTALPKNIHLIAYMNFDNILRID